METDRLGIEDGDIGHHAFLKPWPVNYSSPLTELYGGYGDIET